MPSIVFEPVQDADAPMLADLRVTAMRESLTRAGRFDPIRARERLLADFRAEATRHICVDDAAASGGGRRRQQRVGFVVVTEHDDHLSLDHLYLTPESQGAGIGAGVLAQIFADADTRSLPVAVTALKGSAANRFYVRHGFELMRESEYDRHYIRPPRVGAA